MTGILRIKDAEGVWHDIEAIKGEPGKNGTDYILTEEDKAEIVGLVVATLPVYNGEVVE